MLHGYSLTPVQLVNELVSEFVDTVTSYACKMAKLRKAENIDIKDIQLILERNYNIRIPGYQGDEIRTVRKFAPTATHQARIQQLNQSKVLNATMDKE
jgi:transcription initiation factor TFIID subunit 12